MLNFRLLCAVVLVAEIYSVRAEVDTALALERAQTFIQKLQASEDCPAWVRPGGKLGNGQTSDSSIAELCDIFKTQAANHMSDPIIYDKSKLTPANFNWIGVNYAVRAFYLQSLEFLESKSSKDLIADISAKAIAKTLYNYELDETQLSGLTHDLSAYLNCLNIAVLMKSFRESYPPVNEVINQIDDWQGDSAPTPASLKLTRVFKRTFRDGTFEQIVLEARKQGVPIVANLPSLDRVRSLAEGIWRDSLPIVKDSAIETESTPELQLEVLCRNCIAQMLYNEPEPLITPMIRKSKSKKVPPRPKRAHLHVTKQEVVAKEDSAVTALLVQQNLPSLEQPRADLMSSNAINDQLSIATEIPNESTEDVTEQIEFDTSRQIDLLISLPEPERQSLQVAESYVASNEDLLQDYQIEEPESLINQEPEPPVYKPSVVEVYLKWYSKMLENWFLARFDTEEIKITNPILNNLPTEVAELEGFSEAVASELTIGILDRTPSLTPFFCFSDIQHLSNENINSSTIGEEVEKFALMRIQGAKFLTLTEKEEILGANFQDTLSEIAYRKNYRISLQDRRANFVNDIITDMGYFLSMKLVFDQSSTLDKIQRWIESYGKTRKCSLSITADAIKWYMYTSGDSIQLPEFKSDAPSLLSYMKHESLYVLDYLAATNVN